MRERFNTPDFDAREWYSQNEQEVKIGLALGTGSVVGIMLFVVLGVALGWLNALVLSVAALAGFAMVPLGVIVFGPSLPLGRTALSRVMFTLMQFAYDGSALVKNENGQFETRCLQKDDDGHFVETSDGAVLRPGDAENIYRLGMNPFGIVSRKREQDMQALFPSQDKIRKTVAAEPDGGTLLETNEIRQGYPYLMPTHIQEGQVPVDLTKVWRYMRGNDARLARRAKDEALREEGGQQQVSTLLFVVGVIVCLVLGPLMGWLIMGGLSG